LIFRPIIVDGLCCVARDARDGEIEALIVLAAESDRADADPRSHPGLPVGGEFPKVGRFHGAP
jgi:hypothetical protein